ncbi:MAG: hypothetical protein AAGK78_15615, partial [Planctomycetota bacterium]
MLSTASGVVEPALPHVGRTTDGVVTAVPKAAANLGSPNYYSPSWPFANAFKTASVAGESSPATGKYGNLWLTNRD